MTDDPLYAMLGFTDAEWGLLVGLPQSVLTAASAAPRTAPARPGPRARPGST